MKKFLYHLFGFLALVTFVESIYLFYLTKTKVAPKEQDQQDDHAFSPPPIPTVYLSADISYQAKDDYEGRTVIYQNISYAYPGVGNTYTSSTDSPKLRYKIGTFKNWESIPGSKDRYLSLEDPIHKTELGKSRVTFEPSTLNGNGMNATAIAIEYLIENKVENIKRQIKSLSAEEIDRLIHIGDVIIIYPLTDKNVKPIYDEHKIVLVNWLVLRRNDRKTLNL